MPAAKRNKRRTAGKGKVRCTAFLMIWLLVFALPRFAAGSSEEGSALPAPDQRQISEAEVDPIHNTEGWSAVLYDHTNGLPTSEANDIAETSDGFIWIGSYGGLVRYDGSTFERVDPSTGLTNVKCLLADSKERLWVGTNENGIGVVERGTHRMWGEAEGLKASSVRAIVEDRAGMIYVATSSGINLIDPDCRLGSVEDPDAGELIVNYLQSGADGTIYGLTNDGDIIFLKDGKLTGRLDQEVNHVKNISCILPDPGVPGCFYLQTADSIVYYGSLSDSFKNTRTVNIAPLNQVYKFIPIGQNIWICARNGIGVLDREGFHLLENTPMNSSVVSVMTDYEGNLWFASSRQGVMKIVSNPFSDIFERYDLPQAVVNSTCMYNGHLFIGTDSGLIVLDEDHRIPKVPLKKAQSASGVSLQENDLLEMLDGCRIRSVIRDSRGRLWISTWRSRGLLCYDKGELTAFTAEDGLASDYVRMVHESRSGAFFAACTGGVNVIEDGRITACYDETKGIGNTEILTVAEGKDGDILIGTDGGGIYIVRREGVLHIGTKEGLTSGSVMRIKKDPLQDIYWIVTGNSIAYLTDDYQLTTIRSFPYSNNFDIYENSRGELWVLCSNGIYVLPAEDMLADGEMNPVHYGISNGLPCIATANSYSELTEDGDLYISGTTGAAKINIEEPHQKVVDLKASVPYVEADGERIYPDETGGFTIPSGVRKLTINGVVFNYSLIDPVVSYMLENFDRDLVTVSRSDLDPVTYTNLRGKTYHFIMQLHDPLGEEDKTISVRIDKKKALYERPWFYISMVLLLLAALALGIGWYIRRRIRVIEEQHREQAEKERISAELDMAGRIQNSMLPHRFPPFPGRTEFDIYAYMRPAREVGGDFYDYFLIDEDHLCLVMADVSGKGIPAALFMMVSKVILQSVAMLGRSAGEILRLTNEALCSDNQVEMFVTVWIGILEISTGRITAANAGHEYPAVMKDGRFALMKEQHGFVIGGIDGQTYQEYEILMEPGDKLFVYTDGVPEATDDQNSMFGTKRMLEALNSDAQAAPEQVLKNVLSEIGGFVKEAEQFDDMTMLCIEYKGKAAEDKA